MMKARFEKVIAMEPKTVREKSLRIFRKVVKEFEIRTKDMKDLVKLIRASSFKDLNGELSSLKTLSLRGVGHEDENSKNDLRQVFGDQHHQPDLSIFFFHQQTLLIKFKC